MNAKKIIIIAVIIAITITILAWAFKESTKPLPGQAIGWNSRNHLPEGTLLDYKKKSQPNLSDNEPPTSGDHYASWITKGFYDEPRADGNLVHSMEHGYVIFWYNCEQKLSWNIIPEVFAQAAPTPVGMTAGSEGSPSAKLSEMPKVFNDGSCDSLKNTIKDQFKALGGHKLIAVPRVGMDYPLILTAWGRMEKLTSVDSGAIKDFVSAFRDNGPEQTSEP